MNRLVLLLLLVLLVPAVVAQGTGTTATAVNGYGVGLLGGASYRTHTVPPGASLDRSRFLVQWHDPVSTAPEPSTIDVGAGVLHLPLPDGTSIWELHDSGQVRHDGTSGPLIAATIDGTGQGTTHIARIHWPAADGTQASLTLDWDATAIAVGPVNSSRLSGSVVIDDGSGNPVSVRISRAAPPSPTVPPPTLHRWIPVQVTGTGGLTVTVSFTGVAIGRDFGEAGYLSDLRLAFDGGSTGCTFTNRGASCNSGGTLWGVPFPPDPSGAPVMIALDSPLPGSPGVFVIGSQSVSLPLPGGCLLRTDPAFVAPFVTDPIGGAVLLGTLTPGTAFTTQSIVLDVARSRFAASDLLDVVCR